MPRPKPLQAALMATPDDIEAQFYEALQQGDLEKLMLVWADDEDIVCVHPSGVRVQGHYAVRASFDEMFGQASIDTRPAKVRRTQLGTCAVHHVLEQIRVATSSGLETGHILTTNIYINTSRGWRLLVHHASPGGAQDLDESPEQGTPLLH
ncbi:MAG: nuclear transport factor 2 family protein [Burkholderiales bacterium]